MKKNHFRIIGLTGVALFVNLLCSCKGNETPAGPDNCFKRIIVGKKFNVKQNTGLVYNGTTPVNDVSIGEIKFLEGNKYSSTVKIWGDTGSYSVTEQGVCEYGVLLELKSNQKYTYKTRDEQLSEVSAWFNMVNTSNLKDTLKLGTKTN